MYEITCAPLQRAAFVGPEDIFYYLWCENRIYFSLVNKTKRIKRAELFDIAPTWNGWGGGDVGGWGTQCYSPCMPFECVDQRCHQILVSFVLNVKQSWFMVWWIWTAVTQTASNSKISGGWHSRSLHWTISKTKMCQSKLKEAGVWWRFKNSYTTCVLQQLKSSFLPHSTLELNWLLPTHSPAHNSFCWWWFGPISKQRIFQIPNAYH